MGGKARHGSAKLARRAFIAPLPAAAVLLLLIAVAAGVRRGSQRSASSAPEAILGRGTVPLSADEFLRLAGLLEPSEGGTDGAQEEEEEEVELVDWKPTTADGLDPEVRQQRAAAAMAEEQRLEQLVEEQAKAAQALKDQQELAGVASAAATAAVAEIQHRTLQCAVINNRNWHLDVAAGLAWAFQEAGCNVSTYLANQTFGLNDVMDGWFKGTHRHVLSLVNESYLYDVFILVTFPETHTLLLDALLSKPLPGRSALRRRQQRFFAVVHNPHRLLSRRTAKRLVRNRALLPEMAQAPGGPIAATAAVAAAASAGLSAVVDGPVPRLQMVTLSPATSLYAQQLVEQWVLNTTNSGPNGNLSMPWVSPLAPWRPSFSPVDIRLADDSVFAGFDSSLRHLCIQGIIDPKRRDYAGVFEAVSHPAVLAQLRARSESLLLLGHEAKQPLDIPPGVAPFVHSISGQPYKEFYDTLSRCRAILPAFGSEAYLVNKTSSTIATAINVGTPLLAEERVRGAYTFLPGSVVFSYAAPAGAPASMDIPALAAEQSRQYILEDHAEQKRQAELAWEKGAQVEVALAWLRDEGVELPDDMADKVAAAAAAAASQAHSDKVEDEKMRARLGAAAGGASAQQDPELRRAKAAAERRGHLPALKRAAQKAAEGGPDAEREWQELAARLAALAAVHRRRLLLLDPSQQQLLQQAALQDAARGSGAMPTQQVLVAAQAAPLQVHAGVESLQQQQQQQAEAVEEESGTAGQAAAAQGSAEVWAVPLQQSQPASVQVQQAAPEGKAVWQQAVSQADQEVDKLLEQAAQLRQAATQLQQPSQQVGQQAAHAGAALPQAGQQEAATQQPLQQVLTDAAPSTQQAQQEMRQPQHAQQQAQQQVPLQAQPQAQQQVPLQTQLQAQQQPQKPLHAQLAGMDAEDVAPPPEGSYAAALLRAFETGAAEKAHAAARRLKSKLMRHNRQVAADFLAGVRQLAAQVAAEEAESEHRAAKQRQQQQQGELSAEEAAAIAERALDQAVANELSKQGFKLPKPSR